MYNKPKGELGQLPTLWQPTFSSALWWSFATSALAGAFIYYLLEAKSRR